MIIELGKSNFIDTEKIIGIFDLDITSQSHLTRKFLRIAETDGNIENVAEDIPKSFVISKEKKVYLVQPNTATLTKHFQ